MVSEAQISSDLLAAIRIAAAADPARETCGLLTGAADIVTGQVECRNVADDPSRTFEIDPAALIAVHRAARAGGPQLVGCWHSHPSGDPDPSPRDAAAAAPDGWLWLIVGAGGAIRTWRAVRDGARHGRFDRVTLIERSACGNAAATPQGPNPRE